MTDFRALRRKAQQLGDKGYYVFPARLDYRGDKRELQPLIKWRRDGSARDAETIGVWPWKLATHVCIDCEASRLAVVDLDEKNGKHGLTEWERLQDEHGQAEPGATVPTPSGGQHLLWAAAPDRPLKSGANTLAPGVDTRGVGGMVVAYGDPRELPQVDKLPPLPAWVVELAQQARHSPPEASGRPGNASGSASGPFGGWTLGQLAALPPGDDRRGRDWLLAVAGHQARRHDEYDAYVDAVRAIDQNSDDPHDEGKFANVVDWVWDKEQHKPVEPQQRDVLAKSRRVPATGSPQSEPPTARTDQPEPRPVASGETEPMEPTAPDGAEKTSVPAAGTEAEPQAEPPAPPLTGEGSAGSGGSAPPDYGDGADLLDEAHRFLLRFVAFPSYAAGVAVTLWAAHTYFHSVFYSTPRLALLSPEAGSGKTRVLEILELLVSRPWSILSSSAAAAFRKIDATSPTVLFDEVDTVFRAKATDSAEDLRALLNAGHRKGAKVPRCVGPDHEIEEFSVFAPVALAGLGNLPDTLMSRSVIIRMRKRAPGERVEPFRERLHRPEAEPLQKALREWARQVRRAVAEAWPEMPEGVVDRPADVWEPLLAVADAAGGHWPETARKACVELVAVASERKASLGVRLLADLRSVFGDAVALPSKVIIERLCALEEAPWGDLRGSRLTERKLADLLGAYEVKSKKVKVDGRALQGYRREHLWDAWQRYLPPPGSEEAEPTEPAEPSPARRGARGSGGGSGSVPPRGTQAAGESSGSGGSGGSVPPDTDDEFDL